MCYGNDVQGEHVMLSIRVARTDTFRRGIGLLLSGLRQANLESVAMVGFGDSCERVVHASCTSNVRSTNVTNTATQYSTEARYLIFPEQVLKCLLPSNHCYGERQPIAGGSSVSL